MNKMRATYAFVAVAVLAMAGCSSNGDAEPDVETDHQAAAEQPEPPADSGPAPGRFEQAWELTLDDAPDGYHLIGSQLVVPTETGVQAYDTRTGEPSWHYHEPGRELWAMAASGGAIVLDTSGGEAVDGDSETVTNDHLVGLDAGTGELLWQNQDDWSVLVGGVSGARELTELGDAAGGIIVVEPDAHSRERVGVDARTGEERWRVSQDDFADQCAPENAAAAADTVVLATTRCGGDSPSETAAVALNAESGELAWRRPVNMEGPVIDLDIEAGVTLLGTNYASGSRRPPPTLIDAAGEELYTGEDGSSCTCELYQAGDRLVLRYVAPDTNHVWVVLDPASGKVTQLEEWSELAIGTGQWSVTTAGPAVYGLTAQHSLLPVMLGITDVTTGDTTTAPLPIPALSTSHVHWLDALGDQLFIARRPGQPDANGAQDTTITSYQSVPTDGPFELGGVSPDEWPDPCPLLDGAPEGDDDRQRGILERGEPLQVGGATIPRTACTGRLVGYDQATVSVAWVAATEEEAAMLADGPPLGDSSEIAVPGADDAWTAQEGSTFLRVGRTVVSVSTTAPRETRDAVLETVAENLGAAG